MSDMAMTAHAFGICGRLCPACHPEAYWAEQAVADRAYDQAMREQREEEFREWRSYHEAAGKVFTPAQLEGGRRTFGLPVATS